MRLDLNADVGEGFPYDDELLYLITSANVACGFHAGDQETMRSICELARVRGVVVGAQVSYRDREGFGRRDVDVTAPQLVADLVEQIVALHDAAEHCGIGVGYLKPHGALYNRTVTDSERAGAVVAAAQRFRLPVLGLPGSRLLEQAARAGLPAWREFFADRAYDTDGRLVPRSAVGAVVSDRDLVAGRIRQLVRKGTVTAIDGTPVSVAVDSVCVHGDTPAAARLAYTVRHVLEAEKVVIAAVERRSIR